MGVARSIYLIRSDDIIFAQIGVADSVMLSIESGKYYGLNAVASRVWELLETPQPLSQLCAQIVDEFEIDGEQCERDLRLYIETLLANGIVHAAMPSGA